MKKCAFDENRLCNENCIAYQEDEIILDFEFKIIKCLRGSFIFKTEKEFHIYDTNFQRKK